MYQLFADCISRADNEKPVKSLELRIILTKIAVVIVDTTWFDNNVVGFRQQSSDGITSVVLGFNKKSGGISGLKRNATARHPLETIFPTTELSYHFQDFAGPTENTVSLRTEFSYGVHIPKETTTLKLE